MHTTCLDKFSLQLQNHKQMHHIAKFDKWMD
jgi:hypothetical protein